MTIRLLIADDQQMVAEGLRSLLLHSNEIDTDIVGIARTGRQAVEMAERLAPDVVLMDISMPELNGIDATRRILAHNPAVKVLAFSVHKEPSYITNMFRAGARGYILKESFFEECVVALKTLVRGEFYFGSSLNGAIVDIIREKGPGAAGEAQAAKPELTPREREVLQLIAEGRSTKEIAAVINRSVKTVEMHRQRTMEKLDLHSIAELTKYAIQEGLTTL